MSTRDGHEIAERTPLRRRRFVSRMDFAASSRSAPAIELAGFRSDQDAALDTGVDDPYAR